MVHTVLIGDSRLYNFDNPSIYHPPNTQYSTTYIIQRGATPRSITPLVTRTLSQLHSTQPVVTIALGINSLIYKDRGALKHKEHNTALQELEALKQHILSLKPNATITYATIPPAVVDTSQHAQHLAAIQYINAELIRQNQQHPINPHTPTLHNDILTTHKKRKSNGRQTTNFRIQKHNLYDGLHATSAIKHIWYNKIHRSFQITIDKLNTQ